VDAVNLDHGDLRVEVPDRERFTAAIAPLARTAGARLEALEPVGEDLESVFSYLQRRARGARR